MNDILFIIAATVVFFASLGLRGLFGYIKNNQTNSTITFDWKKFFTGSIWVAIKIAGVGLLAILIISFLWLVNKTGVTISGLEQISTHTLLIGILVADIGSIGSAISQAMSVIFGLSETQISQIQNITSSASSKTNTTTGISIKSSNGELISTVEEVPNTSESYAAKKLSLEQEGGTGAVYSVNISSFDAFKNAVIGNGYDIDGAYGDQCWDGAALLWQQLGKTLYTGNGTALGCWTLKRDINKYDLFDLITDVNSLKAGDVVVMTPNHIGFFVQYVGNYMQILGQNQTGTGTGAPFNLININKSTFAGAFRYHGWNVSTPTSTATTPTTSAPKTITDDLVSEVIRGDWGNGDDRKNRLTAAGYDYNAVQNAVNNRLSASSQSSTNSTPSIGDRVKTNASVDQNGLSLNLNIINDGQSVWSETNSLGNAVLTKDGIVRAGVPISSLYKA